MKFAPRIVIVKPADARGWVGLACFVLTLLVLLMMWADRTLLRDDFFKTIATAIILTGWNNGPVGWVFQATKGGSDLADRNASIVEQQATAATRNNDTSQQAPTVVSGDLNADNIESVEIKK